MADRDALAELHDLLFRGESTLMWVLEHAPDGDADAALQRAWQTTHDLPVLLLLAPTEEAHEAGMRVWRNYHRRREDGSCRAELRRCLQAAIRCPTWAEALERYRG